ncbi:hypothetical protein ACOME3_001378 [Neoechinorhynchus agilis]
MSDKNSPKKSKTCSIEDEQSFHATDLPEDVKKATGESKTLCYESAKSSEMDDSMLLRRSDCACFKKSQRIKDYLLAYSDIEARLLRSRSGEQTLDHSKFGSDNSDPENVNTNEQAIVQKILKPCQDPLMRRPILFRSSNFNIKI